MLHKLFSLLKRNLFLFSMLLSLLLPDALLRMQSYGSHIQELGAVGSLFTLFWISFFVVVCTGFLNKKWGRGIYLVLISVFSVFSVASYIYYRIFNQYFWLDALSMTGQAATYTGAIFGYLDWQVILAFFLQLFLIFLTCRFWRAERYKIPGLLLLVPVLLLVTLHTYMMTETAAQNQEDFERDHAKEIYRTFTDPNRSMQAAGPYQYVFRNLVRMVFPEVNYDDTTVKEVGKYFAEKPVSGNNAMTGLFEGKNVIMVMMESMDDWMIDEDYTPTICAMMENGFTFSNHYACTFGTGYTFNTEFAANTGYHATLVGPSVSELYDSAFPYSLANAFREKGYTAKEIHYNTPDFYNRGKMSAAFGYDEYVSYQKYMPVEDAECDSLAIQNKNVYREIAPLQDAPFFSYVVTYSAHLPYTDDHSKMKKIKALYPELIDRTEDREINNAKILAHDTDEFFRILLQNLKQDGLLENTVIVAFSDHFAYGISSWEKLYAMDDAQTSDMLERTPFFIYCAAAEGQQIAKVTNTLDILPTVVNLMGFTKTPYWMGEDALSPDYGGHAYFSSGSWYDGTLYFITDEQTEEYPEEQLEYIDRMNEKFSLREKINEVVIRTDYFNPEKTPVEKSLP